jgi:hypothetical protein
MTNEIQISKRQQMLVEARRQLHAAEHQATAGEVFAAKTVMILMGSYPQMSLPDPDLYIRQVTTLLTGAPLAAVSAMVDPRSGILTECTFLPSIAELHAWLDKHQRDNRAHMRSLRSEIETLSYDDGPTPPPAHIRERQVAEVREKLGKARDARKAELDAKMDERFRKTQRSVPEEGMQGLRNLDKMVPGSKD